MCDCCRYYLRALEWMRDCGRKLKLLCPLLSLSLLKVLLFPIIVFNESALSYFLAAPPLVTFEFGPYPLVLFPLLRILIKDLSLPSDKQGSKRQEEEGESRAGKADYEREL